MSKIRLHKYIADCGVTSRRKAEDLILEGKVLVEGKRVSTLGYKIDPVNQMVQVNGEVLCQSSVEKIYLVLNKPRGYVTTLADPEGRDTVMDLCREIS
ncbi:MAG: S4 domain-containing protein, partial [Halobacteriovoraceae bacterium]|nr:S4 domain-containing protein [Halobacteriovoraceae bacterium]